MAMDNFLEEVATKRNRGAETVMYVLANIMMVVFGLWAFLMLQGIMMLINAGEGAGPIIYYGVMTLLTGGIAVLLFLRRDRIRTEYEYTSDVCCNAGRFGRRSGYSSCKGGRSFLYIRLTVG